MHMSMHAATRPTPCTTGQVHLLVIYRIAGIYWEKKYLRFLILIYQAIFAIKILIYSELRTPDTIRKIVLI